MKKLKKREVSQSALKNSDPKETGGIELFSNRCAIQCGTFSVRNKNPRTDPRTNKIVRLINYTDDGFDRFSNIEAYPLVGLPTATDLTYYLALQKLLDEDYRYLRSSEERIYFTAYDLMNKIGLSFGRENYDRLSLWGQRMKETSIRIFETEARTRSFGTFSIFQEFITRNSLLEDETKSDESWLLLTKWEINNRLTKRLIPIDFSTYLKIKDEKARILIPHLQVWLYAAQNGNSYKKSYRELCDLLGLKPCLYIKHIEKQFQKPFKLLMEVGYLKSADIYRSESSGEFVVEFVPGLKFLRDPAKFKVVAGGKRSENSSGLNLDLNEDQQAVYIKLVGYGLFPKSALQFVRTKSLTELERQIEYCLSLHETNTKAHLGNYIFKFISNDSLVPDDFQSGNKTGLPDSERTEIEIPDELEKAAWLSGKYEEFCLTGKLPVDISEFSYSNFLENDPAGQKIWSEIRSFIGNQLNRQIFVAWFEPIRYLGFNGKDNQLVISATRVTFEWITAYYEKNLREAIEKTGNQDIQLVWRTGDLRGAIGESEDLPEERHRQCLIAFYQIDGVSFEEFIETNSLAVDSEWDLRTAAD